jgi:hypothetical protein
MSIYASCFDAGRRAGGTWGIIPSTHARGLSVVRVFCLGFCRTVQEPWLLVESVPLGLVDCF